MSQIYLNEADAESLASSIAERIKSLSDGKVALSEDLSAPLKIEQVAQLFGVSKTSIHSWCRSGKLPFFHLGRRLYFPKAAIIKIANGTARGVGK